MTTSATELVTETLSECAETLGDVVPAVYQRFFELDSQSAALMKHADEYMQGRMLEQVFELLMSDQPFAEDGFLDWELNNHLIAYRATPPMYEALFQALVETVKKGAPNTWNDDAEAAWSARTDQVMQRVRMFEPTVA